MNQETKSFKNLGISFLFIMMVADESLRSKLNIWKLNKIAKTNPVV